MNKGLMEFLLKKDVSARSTGINKGLMEFLLKKDVSARGTGMKWGRQVMLRA